MGSTSSLEHQCMKLDRFMTVRKNNQNHRKRKIFSLNKLMGKTHCTVYLQIDKVKVQVKLTGICLFFRNSNVQFSIKMILSLKINLEYNCSVNQCEPMNVHLLSYLEVAPRHSRESFACWPVVALFTCKTGGL